jgi:hypothetical protein
MSDEKPATDQGDRRTANITKIVSAAAGAIILTLQGVNLSELGNVSEEGRQRAIALKGIEQSIEQNSKIQQDLVHSIQQNSDILKNGADMLKYDNEQLRNQEKIIELLQRKPANPSPTP